MKARAAFRDECINEHCFFSLDHARAVPHAWIADDKEECAGRAHARRVCRGRWLHKR